MRQVAANTTVDTTEDMIDAQMDKFEKAILAALEKNAQTLPVEKASAATSLEENYPSYEPPGDQEFQAQVNAAGTGTRIPTGISGN